MAYPKITKRKDGRFQAKVPIGKNPQSGRSVRKTVYGKTKSEVKNKINDLNTQVAKGTIIPTTRTDLKVADWCKQWLELFVSRQSYGTYRRYKGFVKNYIIPVLGDIRLDKLQPIQCQHLINYMTDTAHLNPNTIHRLGFTFKSCLEQAVVLGYIGKNPAQHIKMPKRIAPELTPFTEEEYLAFLNVCTNSTIDNLCKFTLLTGLRQSELLALTWDNLLEDDLKVVHQFGRNKSDKTFYPTKNKQNRVVGLSQKALDTLADQHRIQAQLQISGIGYRNELNLIFTDNKGDRLHCNTISRRFKELCKLIGRDNVRFHDLRHTYAVINLKAGVDPKTISESLGHASVSFTLDQYAYVTSDMRRSSSEKVDAYLNNYS